MKDATWEPRSALMLRCSDMVRAYEETEEEKAAPEPTDMDSTASPPLTSTRQTAEKAETSEVKTPP